MKLFIISLLVFIVYPCIAQETKQYTSREVDRFPSFTKIKCPQEGTEACFANQLNEHITQYFNYPIKALQDQLKGKVFVQFVIDSTGKVGDLKTRSLHKVFEKEGQRIIEKIPRLDAAKINGKPVSMVYNIPIVFNFIAPGESQSIPRTISIDYSENSNAELTFWKDAKSPPVLRLFEGKENKHAGFEDVLKQDIVKNVGSKGYTSKNTTSAKVYFEINANRSIANVNVISTQKDLKNLIEQFIRNDLKVLEPAKNINNEPINCFFTSDIYFSKTK